MVPSNSVARLRSINGEATLTLSSGSETSFDVGGRVNTSRHAIRNEVYQKLFFTGRDS